MPLLHLYTKIKAPIQEIFNLARSNDFHIDFFRFPEGFLQIPWRRR